MSCVTNIIVLTSCLEEKDDTETYPAIEWLNTSIGVDLREISNHAGGNKVFERRMFATATGYGFFDDEVKVALEETPFECRNDVQVLVSRHEQNEFSLFWGMGTEDMQ